MEGLLSFVSILFIVFGILQVILFFKLWGMTDNVKKLEKGLLHSDYYNEVRKCILFGDKEKARELILNKFIERIIKDDYVNSSENNNILTNSKNRLSQELSVIGYEVPEEINKLESATDFFLLFKNSFQATK